MSLQTVLSLWKTPNTGKQWLAQKGECYPQHISESHVQTASVIVICLEVANLLWESWLLQQLDASTADGSVGKGLSRVAWSKDFVCAPNNMLHYTSSIEADQRLRQTCSVTHILVLGVRNHALLTMGSVLWRCCHMIQDADITDVPLTEGNMWVWSGFREHKLCTNIMLFLQVNQVFNKRPWKCQQSEQINQNCNWMFVQTKKSKPFFY